MSKSESTSANDRPATLPPSSSSGTADTTVQPSTDSSESPATRSEIMAAGATSNSDNDTSIAHIGSTSSSEAATDALTSHQRAPPPTSMITTVALSTTTNNAPLAIATPTNLEAIPAAIAQLPTTTPQNYHLHGSALSIPVAVATPLRGDVCVPRLQVGHAPSPHSSLEMRNDHQNETSKKTSVCGWCLHNKILASYLIILLLVGILILAIVVPLVVSRNDGLHVPPDDSPAHSTLDEYATTSLCPMMKGSSSSSSSSCRWEQIGGDLIGPTTGDFFGATFRLGYSAQGTRFSVTAPLYDGAKGLTRVYDIVENNWDDAAATIFADDDKRNEGNAFNVTFQQVGQDMVAASYNDRLEGILSDDGYHLIMSSIDARAKGQPHMGHVGAFYLSQKSNRWEVFGRKMFGNSPEDDFGRVTVNRDGTIMAISDIQFDVHNPAGTYFENAGVVRVYQLNGESDTWELLGQSLTGGSEGEYWGRKIALSGDGYTIAIGSRDFDVGGMEDDLGKVRVYQYIKHLNRWTNWGPDLVGTEKGDKLGREVELSADGKILAVSMNSSWKDEYTGEEGVGAVRVFSFDMDSGQWYAMGNDVVSGHTKQLDFGYQVRLSDDGRRMAIGQSRYTPSDKALSEAGRIQLFDYIEEQQQWVQVGEDIVGKRSCDFVGIGFDLSPDGSRLVVGYPNAEGWGDEGPDCAKDGLGEHVEGIARLFALV